MTTSIVSNGSTPSKLDISWDDFLDGTFPVTPAQQRFNALVHEVTAAAKGALPQLNGRVDRARDLVLAGAVTANADGSFTVASQTARSKSYHIDGGCPCKDAEIEPRCKHVLVRRESGR
ncbi:MAG: hypothetical protein AB7N91_32675 [Candidatus Tectimicrobiota bacterium]